MRNIGFEKVNLQSGFWFEKEKLNREVTINSVYEQFEKSGRINAFNCNWHEGEPNKPHIFWDSDVAKWLEGAAYILAKKNDSKLEANVDFIINMVKRHQCEDGYFNIYFTTVEPEGRFKNRDLHELYCAGHLIEAAIACDKIGKSTLLDCMKKYVSYIYKVFVEEKSAGFATPGHEEIELALLHLYRYTKNKKHLELAKFFIDTRGTENDFYGNAPLFNRKDAYCQAHLPVHEQKEAVGHAVRALYLYTAMAMLAAETDDTELFNTCKILFDDIIKHKMYITGGVGSTYIGEAFTNAYDLPNDTAYAETCASIAMMFFARAMLENESSGVYADIIEREFYNGMLSGISLDGKRFFYENALEINLNEHFSNSFGKPRFPITQRPEIFGCSCCPPNINRVLSSLGGYVFGIENNTLYVNQYTECTLCDKGISCKIKTNYPISGEICISVIGVENIALRIPDWCKKFNINKPYKFINGYAVISDTVDEIKLELNISPRAVFANCHISRDAYKLCVMRGPVVYCAERTDNTEELHRFSIPQAFSFKEKSNNLTKLPDIEIEAFILQSEEDLYSEVSPILENATLKMIPYSTFANRGETDMRVWFNIKI